MEKPKKLADQSLAQQPVCRLERFMARRNITVAVAIDDGNPELIVVTAMN